MADLTGQPSPIFDLFHLDIFYPVARRLYKHCSVSEILALSQTCRSLQSVYRSLISLEWDVDKILRSKDVEVAEITFGNSRYVSRPRQFRAQMARCNTLVGGGVPLQFFKRAIWDGESLNLYHTEPESQEQWTKYLQDLEGYECVEKLIDFTGNPTRRLSRSSFQSPSQNIQILVVLLRDMIRGMPIQAILTGTYSTLFANCFSWNKAYSMHPWTTFIRHEVLLGEPLSYDLKWTKPITFYEQQGWKLRKWERPPPSESRDGLIDETHLLSRRVGDHYTWTITFNTDGINEAARIPDYVLEHAAFCVTTPNSNGSEPRSHAYGNYVFEATGFGAAVLRYRYTTGCYSWRQRLDQTMQHKTLEELHRLNPVDRPCNFELIASNPKFPHLTMSFDKPASWRYYDDEVPELYEQWKTALCHLGP